MTMTKPTATIRPSGAFAYTVSPQCVAPAAPHQYGLDVPYYYLCSLSEITGYADPVSAFRAGRADAIPAVSLI
jgi:hypothetical protein